MRAVSRVPVAAPVEIDRHEMPATGENTGSGRKVTKIDGPVYTIQSESTGYQNLGSTTNVSEMKIYVGKQTKKLHGEKKVGDKVRAEITRGGFANSLQ